MGRSKFTLGVMTTLWIVCLFSSPCSAADSLTGRLDSSSAVWDRIKDNSTNSDTGCNATAFDSWNNGVPYTVFMIETPRAENLSASVTAAKAADGKSLDTFMSLHCQWPPSGPLEDVIASDDDGAGYPHPGLFPSDGILLSPGKTYFLVISGYSNYRPHGDFELSLGGNFMRVNNAPTADNDTYIIDEDILLSIASPGVLVNDTDNERDPLTTVVDQGPANGVLTLQPDGSFSYAPFQNFNGEDQFTYTANDGRADSRPATVRIRINAINDPPEAHIDWAETDEDTPRTIDVLLNDKDVDGAIAPATVTMTTPPANGSTEVNQLSGAITYTPALNFNGSDNFTYTVQDNNNAVSNNGLVSITVRPVNDPPIARPDSPETDEDTPVVVDVLLNDRDIDGLLDPATVQITSGPANGKITINNTTGEVTYTPVLDYHGDDSFSYTIKDNNGADSNTTAVEVTVKPLNDVPLARDDKAATDEDLPVFVDVLANDEDVDSGENFTITGITQGQTGRVAVDSARIIYTPNADVSGRDVFSYTMADSSGATATATVNITINSIPDNPVAGFGRALQFNNEDEFVAVPASIRDDFTIELWFSSTQDDYSDNRSSLGAGLLDGDVADEGFDFGLSIGKGRVLFGVGGDTTLPGCDNGTTIKSPLTYNDGRWHHVAATRATATGKIRLFIDGAIVDNATSCQTSSLGAAQQLTIGASQTLEQFFTGKIDEVRLWNTVLQEDDILAWMYREIDNTHPNYDNMTAYYKLNGQSGSSSIADYLGGAAGEMTNMNTTTARIDSSVRAWATAEDTPLSGKFIGSDPDGCSDNGTDWNLIFSVAEQPFNGQLDVITANDFRYTPYQGFEGTDTFAYVVVDSDNNSSDIFSVAVTVGHEDESDTGGGDGVTGGAAGPTNKKPVIDSMSAAQQEGYRVLFTVAALDPDGTIVSYAWQFSETYSVSTPRASVSHSFDGPGTYAVSLTVKDNNGAETSDVISVEVTESVDDDTPPLPEEDPACTEDADCDDSDFCNGEETCLEGACVEGDVPCADNEVCMEDKQACWTEETVEAKSLVSTFRRPRVRGRRCVWLALNAPDAELFDPALSEIMCAGPGGDDTGVAINQRRQMRRFNDYVLVPLCIKKDAEAGAWLLQLETVSGTAREIITTTIAIK